MNPTDKFESKYCSCTNPSVIYTQMDDLMWWEECGGCAKPIEDSYHYFNHYDGEDHDDDFWD